MALVKVTPAKAETPVTPSVDCNKVAPVTVRVELALMAPSKVFTPEVRKVPTTWRVVEGAVVPIPILVLEAKMLLVEVGLPELSYFTNWPAVPLGTPWMASPSQYRVPPLLYRA